FVLPPTSQPVFSRPPPEPPPSLLRLSTNPHI
ncbi:hypothetical protein A2U01_0057892, partial [Trifolium medium]|nr:hypothetical protein [Trifolium medium]